MDGIQEKINNAFLVVGDATEGFTKQIAAALRKQGRRATHRFVWRQGTRNELGYANFYENFLRWITAIFEANYIGFEYLWTDLNVFVSELQRRKLKKLSDADVLINPPFPARREIVFELIKMQSSLNALKGELGFEVTR